MNNTISLATAHELLQQGKYFTHSEQLPYSDESYYDKVPEKLALVLNQHPWNHITKNEDGTYQVNISFRLGD